MLSGDERKWLQSEDRFWSDAGRRTHARRDFFWVFIGLLLLLVGSVTGLPFRFGGS